MKITDKWYTAACAYLTVVEEICKNSMRCYNPCITNAGSPANASKAKNKLEKDHPKKIGKYGYAKRYHKGLELGKIEALPKIKPLIWCRI